MWLYFNSNGQLETILEHGTPARVGTTAFEIFAVFEQITDETSLSQFSATIKLKKPDLTGSGYPTLLMEPRSALFEKLSSETDTGEFENNHTYYGFLFDFGNWNRDEENEEILLDTDGLWKAIITLIGDNYFVQGAATFNVGGTGTEDATHIDYDIVTSQLVYEINKKADTDKVIITIPNLEADVTEFEEGQLFYSEADKAVYKKVSGSLIQYKWDKEFVYYHIRTLFLKRSSTHPVTPLYTSKKTCKSKGQYMNNGYGSKFANHLFPLRPVLSNEIMNFEDVLETIFGMSFEVLWQHYNYFNMDAGGMLWSREYFPYSKNYRKENGVTRNFINCFKAVTDIDEDNFLNLMKCLFTGKEKKGILRDYQTCSGTTPEEAVTEEKLMNGKMMVKFVEDYQRIQMPSRGENVYKWVGNMAKNWIELQFAIMYDFSIRKINVYIIAIPRRFGTYSTTDIPSRNPM